MADAVLRLEGITKTYASATPAATEVLHGIDLQLARGEFVALIGPSGSAKSTLLNIIGLLDRPSGGILSIEGRDTATLDDDALTRLRGRSIGFIFQHHYLIPAFTALENVMMPELLARGSPDQAMRNHMAANMSGGQQQRVAIARALALDPPLVLADEPTGNLDTKSADSVFELMRRVSADSGTTFLLVTHNTALAHRCDRLVELVDGRIVS